jgi:hypothetical protein
VNVGIRVHKILGYGLTDVTHTDWDIADPRINPDSFWVTRSEPETTYFEFLTEKLSKVEGDRDFALELELHFHRDQEEDGTDSFTWKNAETGLPNVLIVRPIGHPRWYRFDDPLDYEEEYLRGSSMVHRVDLLESGPHPYEGLYMDAETGERLTNDGAVISWRRLLRKLPEDDSDKRMRLLDMLATAIGYESHDEAMRRVVPLVPEEVRRVCEWAGLFTSPTGWKDLRPMLYTYWA